MPTTAEHRDKAEHNEFLVATLNNPFWDWAVTATFYAALHYVEAYLATRNAPHGIHSPRHKIRDSNIQKDATLSPLYTDYRTLKDECHDARYDAQITFNQGDLTRLQPYLTRIKAKLLPLI